MIYDPVPPFRRDFDAARDPYTARNALGITSIGGGGGGAPTTAEYITSSADATLTNERVLTNTPTITWDFTTPGQAKANSTAGGGNVSNSGTPTSGQYAKWVTATTIQGVAPATVLSDIGAQPLDGDLTAIAALSGTNTIYYRSAANTWSGVTIGTGLSFSGGTLACTVSTAGLQPLDADLTSIAGYGGTGTWLYRSASDTWSAVTIGSGLTFISGTLDAPVFTSGAKGEVPASGGGTTNFLRADGTWAAPAGGGGAPTGAQYITAATDATLTAERVGTNSTSITWDFGTAGQALVKRAALTGDVTAPADSNATTIANSVVTYAKIQNVSATDRILGRQSAGAGVVEEIVCTSVARTVLDDTSTGAMLTTLGAQPLDADLTSLAAASGTNTIYYRSAANTWSAVTVGTGLSFTGGALTATASSPAAPTYQRFTSGSGTYTKPGGCTRIKLTLVGAGGSGSNATGAGVAGVAGTATNWGSGMFIAGAGGGGDGASPWLGGVGGTPSGSGTWYDAVNGGRGQGLVGGSVGFTANGGGMGGNSSRGGAGSGGNNTDAGAAPNSGSGGGGNGNGNPWPSPGGGAGATIWAQINSPASSYSYVVGAGGSGASPNAGNGADGIIIVEEFY